MGQGRQEPRGRQGQARCWTHWSLEVGWPNCCRTTWFPRQVESDYVFSDVEGKTRQGATLLQPVAVYLAGREMELARRPFEERFVLDGRCSCCSG